MYVYQISGKLTWLIRRKILKIFLLGMVSWVLSGVCLGNACLSLRLFQILHQALAGNIISLPQY